MDKKRARIYKDCLQEFEFLFFFVCAKQKKRGGAGLPANSSWWLNYYVYI